MPAYSYVVDGYYNDVWALSDVDEKVGPLYLRADSVVDDDSVIGKLSRPWTETQIEDVYGIKDHGPEVWPVHTTKSARLDGFERTHKFVNIP